MTLIRSASLPLFLGLLLCMPAAVLADDRAPERQPTMKSRMDLPGVVQPDGAPLPAAEPERPVTEAPGHYRIGNWDVRVSGSVSFQIGTGRGPDR